MFAYILLSCVVGLSMVLQNGLNHRWAKESDLASVLVINSCAVMGLALLFFIATQLRPELFPSILRPRSAWPHFEPRLLVPGLFGFAIIAGLPIILGKLGALRALVLVTAVQLTSAMVWDAWIEKIPLSLSRVLGALLAVLGTLLVVN